MPSPIADSTCPFFCIGQKKGTLSQHFVTHVSGVWGIRRTLISCCREGRVLMIPSVGSILCNVVTEGALIPCCVCVCGGIR